MSAHLKRTLALLLIAWLVGACGIAASYRTAEQKTIRDFTDHGDYRHIVGVMALTNYTPFTSDQATVPFMRAFIAGLTDAASNARLVIPGRTDVPPFLWDPPRSASGAIDAFAMAAMARQAGFNIIATPALMNIRVKKQHSGIWFFRSQSFSLQIQAQAAIYDTITGARIDLNLLTKDVDIDEDQAAQIQAGQEVPIDELSEVAQEMGEALGERMGDAIAESEWTASVIAVEDGRLTISAGSEAGLQPGDRFAVLDTEGTLTGIDGQRYVVPGIKIGDITVDQTAPWRSTATASSEGPLPVDGIVVPAD